MAGRIRTHDWAATPLGPIVGWPDRLRGAVDICLSTPLACLVGWGDELVQIYNDAAAALIGAKHPDALGRPASESWAEIWPGLGPLIEAAYAHGEARRIDEFALRPDRGRGPELGYFTVACGPVRDADGAIAGAQLTAIETSDAVAARDALRASEERQAFLLALSDALRPLDDPGEIEAKAARLLAEHLEAGRTACAEREAGAAPHDGAAARGPGVPFAGPGDLVASPSGVEPARARTAQEAALVQDTAERTRNAVERARAEDRLRRKNAVLEGVNRIFREALTAASEEELGRVCLAVAEEVTGSAFSFMGEINAETDRLDDLSVSERGWAAFTMDDPNFPYGKVPTGFRIHGLYGRVLRDGRGLIANDPATHPDRIGTPPGHPRLQASLGVPLIQAGRTVGMVGMGNRPGGYRAEDLEAAEALAPAILQAVLNKRTSTALRESEERFRQFTDASSDLLWIRDADTLRLEYAGPAFEAIYGVRSEAALANGAVRRWIERIHPADRARTIAVLRRLRAGERVSHEFRILRASDGEERWIRNTDFPLVDAAGRVQRLGGIATDITQQRRAAERMQVLVAELQHRTRNLLGVVRSVAGRTLAGSGSLADFQRRFEDRLAALARVNGLLSRLDAGGRITFDDLIRSELAAHGVVAPESGGTQVVLAGPSGIRLRSSTVQVFALGLHELATNALKYGALSQPEGRLRVDWRLVRGRREAPRLRVEWRESGVAVTLTEEELSRRRGYGRELIEQALPYQLNAETDYALAPDGVRCTIVLPISTQAAEP